jgi:hypothetical protein
MLRLATDEDFNNRILRGLLHRAPDLDVVRAQDAGLILKIETARHPLAQAPEERKIRDVAPPELGEIVHPFYKHQAPLEPKAEILLFSIHCQETERTALMKLTLHHER